MRKTAITLTTAIAIGLLAGSAIGVAAQDETSEPANPVEFTGKISFGPCEPYTTERLPGKTEHRGEHYCRLGLVEPFSDSRLVGDYYVWNYRDEHDGGPTVFRTAFSIVNDDGAWRGVPVVSMGPTKTDVLIGDGAYEGLTAIATVDLNGEIWDWRGWIIEGDVPPLPEEPSAIQ